LTIDKPIPVFSLVSLAAKVSKIVNIFAWSSGATGQTHTKKWRDTKKGIYNKY
jgi:hypothetical protein